MVHGIQIQPFSPGSDDPLSMEAVEEIFFLSSTRQAFADERERAAWSDAWLGPYRRSFSRWIYVARVEEGTVAGYLTGCPDSRLFQGKMLPGMEVFEDLHPRFPAHFHINCHPDWRSQGVGSALVSHWLEAVSSEAEGVHIITAADARNREFYRKNGFHFEEERRGLVFMGRAI